MLDIKFIKENPELVKSGAKAKNYNVDIDALLKIDEERVAISIKRDALRSELKIDKKPTPSELKKLEKTKKELQSVEKKYEEIDAKFKKIMLSLPAIPRDDVKIGKDESENEIIKKVGKPRVFKFKPKSHLELAKDIDTDRATKVSGSRFAYLKGKIAQLEIALINYTFDILIKEGFNPVFPPVLINRDSMSAMGYLEHGGENETYRLEKDDMFLVGTSEQSIGPMHKDEIFSESDLPIRYCAFSTCFRREAGSSGKDTAGIFRVHQFDKIEMFSFVKPGDSDREHNFLLELEERIVSGLDLPYRVSKMVTGDLGIPAARKYDIETWIPSQEKYRETHSTSTCVDFQSRRLNIKYRDDEGNKYFVHTLNGTAVAIGRMIIAIIENNQQEDGRIVIPKAIQKYTGFKEIA